MLLAIVVVLTFGLLKVKWIYSTDLSVPTAHNVKPRGFGVCTKRPQDLQTLNKSVHRNAAHLSVLNVIIVFRPIM
jgi:hypothetical protein